MYKTISNEIIRQFNPCYDPSKFITDETEELPVKDWVQKYRKIVPAKDIFWLLLREEFLSEKDLILFVVWCARESLKLIENPDKRSVEACDVAERYANGEATKEELLSAREAAHDAAHDVYIGDYIVDYNVTYAANAAANAAYYAVSTAHHASNGNNAAHYAAHVSNDAAADAAYYISKTAYADYYSAYYSARDAQLDKLLTYC
jgi:hypothetical protein